MEENCVYLRIDVEYYSVHLYESALCLYGAAAAAAVVALPHLSCAFTQNDVRYLFSCSVYYVRSRIYTSESRNMGFGLYTYTHIHRIYTLKMSIIAPNMHTYIETLQRYEFTKYTNLCIEYVYMKRCVCGFRYVLIHSILSFVRTNLLYRYVCYHSFSFVKGR